MPTLNEMNEAYQKHIIADIDNVNLDTVLWHPNMAIIYGMAYTMLEFEAGGSKLSDEWDKFQNPVRSYDFEDPEWKIDENSKAPEDRIVADALDLLRHMTRDQRAVTMHCIRVMLYADPGDTFYLANPTRFAEYIQAMKDLRKFKGHAPFVCTKCHKVYDMRDEYEIMRKSHKGAKLTLAILFNSCNQWECAKCFK